MRWCVCVFMLLHACLAFELQDTIHALIEENIHLHDQLENLTKALRELRQLLLHNAGEQTSVSEEELQHLWEEWSLHGISPETHYLMEHALCHDSTIKVCSLPLLLWGLLIGYFLLV